MAVDTYGATRKDVDKLLIWDVDKSTDPPPSMVDDWLEEHASELHGSIGDLIEGQPCATEGFRLRAKRIVVLYTAAVAEDAHYPERAGDRSAGDYGARLYERAERLQAKLVTDVENCRDGIDSGSAHGGSGHSFPSPPMFSRDMGG